MISHPRVAALVAAFETIARTRMAGIPILNSALIVAAIGFEPLPQSALGKPDDASHTLREDAPQYLGILLTPWFMNLVCLPASFESAAAPNRSYLLGDRVFDFLGMHDEHVGGFSCSSLFSPVLEFADQATALAAGSEVLRLIRTPVVQTISTATAPSEKPKQGLEQPSRRGFLLGGTRR